MSNLSAHPARSPEFLSRLHDGDLEAGERAQFESHRAHCSECRDRAAEFETALSFFRSSRTGPAPPDLSSRILRKLQASNRRRSPLGVSFGIDLKWAGAFVAALIAVIVGSSIVIQREARPTAGPDSPISVVVQKKAAPVEKERNTSGSALERVGADEKSAAGEAGRLAKPQRRSAPPAESREETAAYAPEPQSSKRRDPASEADRALDKIAAADSRSNKRPAARAKKESMREVAAAAPAAPPPRAEAQGGEGAANFASDGAAAVTQLRVIAIADDQGTAPDVVNADHVTLTTADRGEYVLLFRPDGSVASAERSEDKKTKALRKDAAAALAPGELWRLKFRPGDRPRRLVVRVE
jgi:hypothetical protein